MQALLDAARRGLADAAAAVDPAERFATAHLSALRAAAAVLAARARPAEAGAKPRGPTSAWSLLPVVAPELGEWSAYFAAGARKRQVAEAGVRSAVTEREADDLVRDAEMFLAVVQVTVRQPRRGPAGLRAAG